MNDANQNMTNSYRHEAYFFIACQEFTHSAKMQNLIIPLKEEVLGYLFTEIPASSLEREWSCICVSEEY